MDRPRDPFDDLADLFLTPEDDGDLGDTDGDLAGAAHAASPTPQALPPVAVAVAGHLPVSAGLWLSQLADRLAREQGPTGLVRFVAGQVHIEVFRAGTGHDVGDPLDLHDALRAATSLAERWIVVPEASVASADVLRAAGDGLMLLTGADEAAVVAAYRLLKDLAEEAMVAGRPLPPISVGVLGAGDVAVASAMMKLHRTADAFLSVDLPLAITMPRMEPLESSLRIMLPAPRTVAFEDVPELLRRFVTERGGATAWPFSAPPEAGETMPEPTSDDRDVPDLADPPEIETLLPETPVETGEPFESRESREPAEATSARDPQPKPSPHSEPKSSPESSAESEIGDELDTRSAKDAPEATAEVHSNPDALRRVVAGTSGPWSSLGGAEEIRSADGEPVEPAKLAPHPGTDSSERPLEAVLDAAEDHEPLLARFEELTPLPVSCPYHPKVELGVDTSGRLHLVASHHRIAEVEATAAWVVDHAAMLRLACPGVSAGGDPIVDLVTERPSEVLALQHSRIRLHLVARVALGGEAGWLRLPLNAAAEAGGSPDGSEATPEAS